MRYAVSDIHGRLDKLKELLEVINFSENDMLYIVGDVVDDGYMGIELLNFIRSIDNIIMIKGNWESLIKNTYIDNIIAYYKRKDNKIGLKIMEGLHPSFGDELYKYIKSLPNFIIDDKFILVHAGINLPENHDNLTLNEIMDMQSEYDLLFRREFVREKRYIQGYTVICGHTPVNCIDVTNEKILKREGKIFIDCAVDDEGYLGCLRLDDMMEFYV